MRERSPHGHPRFRNSLLRTLGRMRGERPDHGPLEVSRACCTASGDVIGWMEMGVGGGASQMTNLREIYQFTRSLDWTASRSAWHGMAWRGKRRRKRKSKSNHGKSKGCTSPDRAVEKQPKRLLLLSMAACFQRPCCVFRPMIEGCAANCAWWTSTPG